MNRHVVIVGGGATGVAAFVSLVKRGVASRIDIVEPRPVAQGVAFNTTERALLCNTSVDTMSVVPGAPDDFLRFLRGEGLAAAPNDFASRSHFLRYLNDRYATYRDLAVRRGVRLRHVARRARAIGAEPDGGYRVWLDDGGSLPATHVLVGLGYGEPTVPDVVAEHRGKDLLFPSPYPERALLEQIPPRARVLVLGTRLSAIDVTLLLCAGHDRSVVMASPSGELPAVRTGTPRVPDVGIDATAFRALDFTGPLLPQRVCVLVGRATRRAGSPWPGRRAATPDDTVERLRAETALAAGGKTPWQDVLFELVDLTNEALAVQDGEVRDTAIRSCHGLLARYLCAIPLGTARTLLGYLDAGRVSVRSGVPRRLVRLGATWLAEWPGGLVSTFDAVVCATGFHKPQLCARDGLLDLVTGPSRGFSPPEVGPDLRVTLPGRSEPEQIWLLGIASHVRVPLVSAVYVAARQADTVARQLAGGRAKALSPVASVR